MNFDWTISLGNLLTVFGFAGSGVIFVMMMRGDMMVLGQRVTSLEVAFKQLVDATISVARQETRISALDERVTMISHRLDDHINKSDRN